MNAEVTSSFEIRCSIFCGSRMFDLFGTGSSGLGGGDPLPASPKFQRAEFWGGVCSQNPFFDRISRGLRLCISANLLKCAILLAEIIKLR